MAEPPAHSKLIPSICDWWKKDAQSNGSISALRHLLTSLWEFTRDSTPARRRQRYGDVDYDWDHRVDTTGATIGWRERLLGTLHSPYQPTEAMLFREMLDSLKIDFHKFTFIDLGSGKGRTLLMASDYPFHSILGVELIPSLHAIAQNNIAAYKKDSQVCFALKSICADARDFKFPAEPTVLYLFNPLPASGLSVVLENLKQSLQKSPRCLYVLYHNPEHEHLFEKCSYLKKTGGTHQYALYVAIPPFS
jgi:SAM-dependent methyltransferase